MASPVIQNTFLSTYKDDYRDSDNYYRILFNSGRALQARELTQLQTIIQKEIERLGRYLFNEGSIISSNLGSSATRSFAAHFIKLDTSVNALPSNYVALENTFITNNLVSPISANVLKVIPATGSDPATLIVSYSNGGSNTPVDTTAPLTFSPGQDITTTLGTLTVQTTNTVGNPAVGRASLITIPENEVFSLGHFVYTPRQTLIVNKYSDVYSGIVGYKITEQIVSVADNIALYDNTGSTPNLTSPGADRYRIVLLLSREEDIDPNTDTFIPLIKMRDGRLEILQNTDNVLNRLADTLALRTAEIQGSFITSDKDKFALQILNDSDNDYLRYIVKPGTAYVKGYRLSTSINTEFRVKKPRTSDGNLDILNIDNHKMTTKFGNYYLADSMYGMLGLLPTNSLINIYDSDDLGGTKIGTARIRHVDKIEDHYRLYVFDVQPDSSGIGTVYNLTTARSVGTDSFNKANLILTDNQQNVKIQEPGKTHLLFSLPYPTPYDIGEATMTVSEVFTSTTNGSGEVAFTVTNAGEVFSDQRDWILKYDSAGEVVNTLVVDSGGVGFGSMRLSGLVANKNVTLLGYVTITADVVSATPRSNQTTTGSLDSDRRIVIPSTSVTGIKSIIDDTTSLDILYKFNITEKSNTSYRDVVELTLKDQYQLPAGTVTITYNDVLVGTGDYFNVNSYSGFEYDDIPNLPVRGITLTNQLDFRPSKDITSSNFTGTGANVLRLPKNNSIVTFDYVEYYKGRTDTIYIDPYSTSLKLLQGINKGYYPEPQQLPNSVIPLHQIALNPYTYTSEDLTKIRYSHRHYRQADIASLDRRLSNLEELTSLSFLETSVMNLSVIDANGLERTKLGITADNFKSHGQSLNINNVDWRASIDQAAGVMRPIQIRRMVPLWYDSDNSINVRRFNNIIMPDFDENLLIEQTIASRPTDVNQSFLPRFTGSLELNPDHDYWTERRTVNNGTEKIVISDGDLSSYDKFQEYGG